MTEKKITGYELSRKWFDFCFDNPEKISPAHTAIYFFAIEHHNRLGWKEKFGFPSQMVMDAVGIKKHHTYIKYFRDIVDWGFFELIQESKNQYSSNIIRLNNALPKNGTALGKAMAKHAAKHGQSTRQSTGCIDKPITIEPKKEIYTPDEIKEVFASEIAKRTVEVFCTRGFVLKRDPRKLQEFYDWLTELWNDTGKDAKLWDEKLKAFRDWSETKKVKNHKSTFRNFFKD